MMKNKKSKIWLKVTSFDRFLRYVSLIVILLLLPKIQVFAESSIISNEVTYKTIESENVAQQQQKTITGKVYDIDGVPLPGVTVVFKGTSKGTVTDIDGNFTLLDVPENAKLQFSFVGMKTQEIAIRDQTNITLVLIEDSIGLDEFVAIGYGTQKKKLVTGATSQINSEDINRQNTISPIDALKSTSGMQITKTSGQPGSGYRINIRGLGTTGDSSPLFIVDGVPVSNINHLNPSDIESIDILKDAASAAIYGSRSANGVVLVTTKKGKYQSRTSITYDGYVGVQNLYRKTPTLNAQEYAIMMNEARLNDGLRPYNFASLVPNWAAIESGNNKGTDWLDEMLVKNAPIQNHSIGINGGTDKSRYSLGFSFSSQDGILGDPVASSYDRYNLRINSEHVIFDNYDFTILKIGENLSYSYVENSGIAVGGMYTNSIRNALSTSPFMPVYNEQGDYQRAIDWDIRVPNPIAMMDYMHGNNITKTHKLFGNAYVELQPIENLKLKSSFGYDLALAPIEAIFLSLI